MRRLKFKNRAYGQRGATAVEFAIVAPLFFGLVFSIVEAGWFFFATSAVEQANAKAARLIRTGQAQNAKDVDGNQVYNSQRFYDEICKVVKAFGDCDDTLTIDVARYTTFQQLADDTNAPVCRDADDPSIQGTQFNEADYGAQSEIIRVRVCFLYKPINPALGLRLSTDDNGRKQMISLAIFRNEPFED
ncbi:MAG: TadE/TadG family type IV pilus assembly protein [Pseudomonadota bacterium]